MATVETIHAIYQEIFGRQADAPALEARAGQTPSEVRADLLASNEFRVRQRQREAAERRERESRERLFQRRQDKLQRQARRDAERRQQRDAFSNVKTVLKRYGLGDLSKWAWQRITKGSSQDQVLLELQEQDPFKERFAAIEQRRKKGLPAISPAEVIEFENQARSLMRAAGLPKGFYDQPEDFTAFLVNDVGIPELQNRIALAEQAVFNEDPVIRAERARFGVSPGEEVAMALDADRAFPEIARRFASAGLSAQAVRSGFGGLEQQEAESLLDRGVDPGQVAERTGFLAQNRELLTGLPGTSESDISRGTQLDFVAGAAPAQEQLTRQAERRRAAFREGGSFVGSQAGIPGLGTSR